MDAKTRVKVTKFMTLELYDSERLDRLSLRVLDACARVRKLAQISRDEELPAVGLNDRKALEWLDKFEDWLFRAESEVGHFVQKNRAGRLARQLKERPREERPRE